LSGQFSTNAAWGREPAIDSGGSWKEADVGTDSFGLLDDVDPQTWRLAVGVSRGGEHREGCGLAGAVWRRRRPNLSGWQVKLTLAKARIFTRFLSGIVEGRGLLKSSQAP